jgi:stage V sporulation protein SpoVS
MAHKASSPGLVEIERLGAIVNESIKAFAITTHLAQDRIVDLLGEINVNVLDEVQAAVENLRGVEGVDPVGIAVALEETIKAISLITHLDTNEITKIITGGNGLSVEDIVRKLHERCIHHHNSSSGFEATIQGCS